MVELPLEIDDAGLEVHGEALPEVLGGLAHVHDPLLVDEDEAAGTGRDLQLGRLIGQGFRDRQGAGVDRAILQRHDEEPLAVEPLHARPLHGDRPVHILQADLERPGVERLDLAGHPVAVLHVEHVVLFTGAAAIIGPEGSGVEQNGAQTNGSNAHDGRSSGAHTCVPDCGAMYGETNRRRDVLPVSQGLAR